MSTLRMSCPYVGTLDLRVLQFNSSMVGAFSSNQTKRKKHHWPVKASQQQLQLQVQFNGWEEYNALQSYVRSHHVRSLETVQYPEVTLYWPQRNIDNWSGLIKSLQGGDERFNIAPRATMDIILIDSLLSEKTFTHSSGESVAKWYESQMSNPLPFKPPNPANIPNDTPIGPGFVGGTR